MKMTTLKSIFCKEEAVSFVLRKERIMSKSDLE